MMAVGGAAVIQQSTKQISDFKSVASFGFLIEIYRVCRLYDCLLLAAGCLLPAADYQLPAADYLLVAGYAEQLSSRLCRVFVMLPADLYLYFSFTPTPKL